MSQFKCHRSPLIFGQRKAARKAKAKDDPYYLYDEKDDANNDIDDIPIVRLDDADLAEDSKYQSPIFVLLPWLTNSTSDPPGASDRSSPRPRTDFTEDATVTPDFDRTGEMPDQSWPPASANGSITPITTGLAAVDLSETHETSRSKSSNGGRYEEYKVDGEDEKGIVDEPVKDVEVVRVRRKKRDGEKKQKKAVAT